MASGAAPGSRFELLAEARHFPHLEDPEGLADSLARFLAETEPAHLTEADWEHLMRRDSRLRPLAA